MRDGCETSVPLPVPLLSASWCDRMVPSFLLLFHHSYLDSCCAVCCATYSAHEARAGLYTDGVVSGRNCHGQPDDEEEAGKGACQHGRVDEERRRRRQGRVRVSMAGGVVWRWHEVL